MKVGAARHIAFSARQIRNIWFLSLCLLALEITCSASEKTHVVIVAIDDSGSMRQNDPGRIRAEAAIMLGHLLTDGDRFGVIAFGGDARWLVQPTQIGTAPTGDKALSLSAEEPRTDFVAPLRLVIEYVSQQPQDFRTAYDISVVLLTDGAPDPDPGKYHGNAAEENRTEALQFSQRLSSMGVRLYTIGLGRTVEADFLSNLATTAHGLYSPSRTAGELRDAFLRVFTHVCGMPVYQESIGEPQVHLDLGARVTRSLVFFFHDDPKSILKTSGTRIVGTAHISVYEQHNPQRELQAEVLGQPAGTSTIVAVNQPLRFELLKPLPAAILIDTNVDVSAILSGGGEVVWDKLFMQDSTVQLRLTSGNGHNYARVLAADPRTRRFEAIIQPMEPGEYDATIELTSPYGAVSTNVGKISIGETPTSLPEQIEVDYPNLPAFVPVGWFASTRTTVRGLLPTGTVRVRFPLVDSVDIFPNELAVDAAHPASLRIAVRNPTDVSNPVSVNYETLWSDGQQEQRRVSVMIVVARRVPLLTYLGERKLKLVEILSSILFAVWIYRRFISRPALRGVLLVNGPGQATSRRFEAYGTRISVYESKALEKNSSDKIRIATGRDRLLFTIKLIHRNGQWKPLLEPGTTTTLSGPLMPSNGNPITVSDSGLTIEFHNFHKA